MQNSNNSGFEKGWQYPSYTHQNVNEPLLVSLCKYRESKYQILMSALKCGMRKTDNLVFVGCWGWKTQLQLPLCPSDEYCYYLAIPGYLFQEYRIVEKYEII